MKRTNFWFLSKKPLSGELVEDFVANSFENAGIAFSGESFEKTNPQILELVHTTYKIPLAIYISKKTKLTSNYSEYFSSTIYPFHKHLTSLKESEIISFRISSNINSKDILNQLSDYFLFKGSFPKNKTVFKINDFSPFIYDINFRILLRKFGVENYLISLSKKNLMMLKNDFIVSENSVENNESNDFEILDKWRTQIDVLDNILIDTLNQRKQIVLEMGKFKKQNNLPYFQPERWHDILTSRKKTGKAANIDEELIEKIFEAIHLNNLKSMLGEEN